MFTGIAMKAGLSLFDRSTRTRINKAAPINALTFIGRPPNSALRLAMVIIKKTSAIICGLAISK